MKVQIVRKTAKLPVRRSRLAAGYDLFSCEGVILQPMTITVLNIGLVLSIPEQHSGRIAPRMSLSMKGILCHASIIDADFRGEVSIILQNIGTTEHCILKHDKIAQLIIEKISTPSVVPVTDLV